MQCVDYTWRSSLTIQKRYFSLACLSGVTLKYRVSDCGRIFIYRAAPNDTETLPVGKRPIKINAKAQLRRIFRKCLSFSSRAHGARRCREGHGAAHALMRRKHNRVSAPRTTRSVALSRKQAKRCPYIWFTVITKRPPLTRPQAAGMRIPCPSEQQDVM